MATEPTLCKIVDWEENSDDAIVCMPYGDIEKLVEEFEDHKGCRGVLPPYSNDQTYTARCASVARDKLSGATIIVAALGGHRTAVAGFASALQNDGFNIMFHSKVGRQNMVNLLHFWYKEFRDDIWYHVAGIRPPNHFAGTWTWSWEEISE